MSASITITKATLGGHPSSNVIASVDYRLCNSGVPYTNAENGAVILPNGNFQTPVVIGGLTEGSCYEIRVTNNCDGKGTTKNIIAASTTTPEVVDMDTETAIEEL